MGVFKSRALLLAKGIAMGAADVVPGVSGGTIAFITGIYERLLNALKSVDAQAFKLLIQFKIKDLWAHVHGGFLLTLLSGIGISILALSRLVLYLLEFHPIVLWSFFFGLILASTWLVYQTIRRKYMPLVYLALIIGFAFAFWITSVTPSETPEALWFVFLSGAIAICAMILPGISGSFILLLMGKYEFILGAVKQLNFPVIITFAAGCIVGILSFANLLSFLLRRFHDATVAILTGFMLGSLNKVWPWKQVVETYTNSKGVVKPLIERNLLPSTFESVTGQSPLFLASLVFAALGLFLVIGIHLLATRETKGNS